MMPIKYKWEDDKLIKSTSAAITLFKLSPKGDLKKQWSTPCDYTFHGSLHLSDDGKTLVQIHSQFSTDGVFYDKRESQAVLVFYRKGKIIASYTAKELVSDFKKGLQPNMFGGLGTFWIIKSVIKSSDDYSIETKIGGETDHEENPDVFQLTTIEGMHYLFDLKTGSILLKKKIEAEKTEKEADPDADPFGDPFE